MLRTSEFILNFILNSCWQIAVDLRDRGCRRVAPQEWPSPLSPCVVDCRTDGVSRRAVVNRNAFCAGVGFEFSNRGAFSSGYERGGYR